MIKGSLALKGDPVRRNLRRFSLLGFLSMLFLTLEEGRAVRLCGSCTWNTRCGEATGNCGNGKLYGVRWTEKDSCYELEGVPLQVAEVRHLHGKEDKSCWVSSHPSD